MNQGLVGVAVYLVFLSCLRGSELKTWQSKLLNFKEKIPHSPNTPSPGTSCKCLIYKGNPDSLKKGSKPGDGRVVPYAVGVEGPWHTLRQQRAMFNV